MLFRSSINWKIIKGNIYKINNDMNGTPCIITPGRSKFEKGYNIPYDFFISSMKREIDMCKRIIFIGYGFNDPHLQTHFYSSEYRKIPKLIITETLTDNAKKFYKENDRIIAITKDDKGNGHIDIKGFMDTNNKDFIYNKNISNIEVLYKDLIGDE